MFQWSKKVVKSVTFNPGVADESLLDLIERYLEEDPEKTFSDLCKEALWQALCVPDSVKPGSKVTENAPVGSIEQQVAELRRQMADLEERFFAKESNRLDMMERHMMQLSQQIAQLAVSVHQSGTIPNPNESNVAVEVAKPAPPTPKIPPQEDDPVISRISQFVEDF